MSMCASYDYVAVTMICRHDISTSHVEPAVKAVLESCIMENEADRFISNLRVTTDRYFNVIPYFVCMCVCSAVMLNVWLHCSHVHHFLCRMCQC